MRLLTDVLETSYKFTMKGFGIFNDILSTFFCICLLCITFFSVIYSNFKDVPSVLSLLSKSHVYENVSTLLRLDIEARYPQTIRNNILLYGIANKLLDIVVTPQTVQAISRPAIEFSFAFAKAPTSILKDKVVISTSIYKKQAEQVLEEFGLPKIVLVNADLLINSIPSQLTIVDLQKRPNSVLALIIKARTLFRESLVGLRVSWIVLGVVVILSLLHNVRHIRNFFAFLWVGFGASGFLILALSFLSPWMLSMVLPHTEDAIAVAQNTLISDVVLYFMSQIRITAIYFLLCGILLFLFWRFMKFEKIQSPINKILQRFHVPTVTVKIK